MSPRVATVAWMAVGLGLAPAIVRAEDEFRTWTDATGRFKVEATLVEQAGETVRLRRRDGALLELPTAKLSEADRQHLLDVDADNPFKVVPAETTTSTPAATSPAGMAPAETPTPAPPVAPMSAASTSDAGARPAPPPAAAPPPDGAAGPITPRTVDWAAIPGFDTAFAAGPPAVSTTDLRPVLTDAPVVDLGPMGDFHESVSGFVLDEATGTAILSSHFRDRAARAERTRITRIDLATGEADDPISVPGEVRALAWDGRTGRLVVADRRTGFDAKPLALWRVAGGRHTVLGELVGTTHGGGGRVGEWTAAAFLAGDRLATLTDGTRVTVWGVPEFEGLATAEVPRTKRLAVTHDGRNVGLPSRRGATIVDASDLTGRGSVGSLDGGPPATAAFSPDGGRLALLGGGAARVFDTRTGTPVGTATETSPHDDAVAFLDERTLFVGRKAIDLATGLTVFEVAGHERDFVVGGGRVWFVALDRGPEVMRLVATPPIPASAAEQLAEIAARPLEYDLPPASEVAVDVSMVAADERAGLATALASQLVAAGHTVREGAPTVLAVRWERGEERTYVYTRVAGGSSLPGVPRLPGGPMFPGVPRPPGGPGFGGLPSLPGLPGRGRSGEEVLEKYEITIEPAILTLLLTREGRTVWSRTVNQLPTELRGRTSPFGIGTSYRLPGETSVEDFVEEIETPQWSELGAWELPASLETPGPRSRPLFGTYRVTSTGIE